MVHAQVVPRFFMLLIDDFSTGFFGEMRSFFLLVPRYEIALILLSVKNELALFSWKSFGGVLCGKVKYCSEQLCLKCNSSDNSITQRASIFIQIFLILLFIHFSFYSNI